MIPNFFVSFIPQATTSQDRNEVCGIRDRRGGIRDQRGGIRDQKGGIRDQKGGIRDQKGRDQGSEGWDQGSEGWDQGSEGWDQGSKGAGSGIRRVGSGITVPIRDHKPWDQDQQFFSGITGIRLCSVGSGNKMCHVFGIKDQNFGLKKWDQR